MNRLVVACCLALLSTPAMAQNVRSLGTGSTALSEDRAAPDTRRTGETNAQGERLQCRNIQAQSYSHMGGRRVCRTAQEWRAAPHQIPQLCTVGEPITQRMIALN